MATRDGAAFEPDGAAVLSRLRCQLGLKSQCGVRSEAAVEVEPFLCEGQCLAVQAPEPFLATAFTRDECCVPQNPDVPGNGRSRHVEWLGQNADICFAFGQPRKDCTANRICDGVEDGVQALT